MISGGHFWNFCKFGHPFLDDLLCPNCPPALLIIWWYRRFVIWGYLVILGSMTECVMVVSGHQRRVLGELAGKELTTPDMLVTNNWTRLVQDQLDKDPWPIGQSSTTQGRYETRNWKKDLWGCEYDPMWVWSDNFWKYLHYLRSFGTPLQNPHLVAFSDTL